MTVEQTTVWGENFVGLMGLATDKYAIACPGFDEAKLLGVPALNTKVYGTNLVGMFCCGNSNGLLLPYFTPDCELREIKEFMGGLGVEVGRMEGKYTALGNMMTANDKAAYVSEAVMEYKTVEDVLGVEAVTGTVGGRIEVGAYVVATNKGFLTHPDAEKQLDELKSLFKVGGMLGTVNCGVQFVKSGIVANSNGYITGIRTTGIELQRIDDALGFM